MARDSIGTPILELRNVNLSYGNHPVLEQITLRIDECERIALIGPSGHGKSSLLKLLAGLIRPTQGQFLFEGRDFHSLSAKEQQVSRLRMGMLFQKNALFDSMRNIENVLFPLRELEKASALAGSTMRVGSADESQLISKAKSYLEAVGLAHVIDLYPDEISGGMQKRLGIARAMVLDPEIVFYDDPTAGLDPITSRKIVDLIVDLQKKRKSTAIAVTNDMNRARQMAQRILMVVDKKVIEVGSPDQMRQHSDPRVHQFIHGLSRGPLTGLQ